MPRAKMWLLMLMVLVLAGCGEGPAVRVAGSPAKTAAAVAPCLPQVVVVGIDRSGSYTAMLPAGLAHLAALVRTRSCPGSTWYIRTIATESFSDREIVFTLRVPDVPAVCTNPFDQQCKAQAARRARTVAAIQAEAGRRLSELRLPVARFTDYHGFFSKSAVLLTAAPAGAERYVVIAGDLVDDRGLRSPLELRGVRVVVVAYQGGRHAAASEQRLKGWERSLRSAGIRVFVVGDPSEPAERVWDRSR